jgi:hypothetical protein
VRGSPNYGLQEVRQRIVTKNGEFEPTAKEKVK